MSYERSGQKESIIPNAYELYEKYIKNKNKKNKKEYIEKSPTILYKEESNSKIKNNISLTKFDTTIEKNQINNNKIIDKTNTINISNPNIDKKKYNEDINNFKIKRAKNKRNEILSLKRFKKIMKQIIIINKMKVSNILKK